MTACSAPTNAPQAASAMSVMTGAPRFAAVPVANTSSVSLVEVSPSTVMQLNVLSDNGETSRCSSDCSIAASVKMKHSMVAMSGAIMPAPLQKPLMCTSAPAILTVRVESFG